MNIELSLSNGAPMEFLPGLPPGYSGPVLAGADSIYCKSRNIQLVIHELAGENYSIRLSVCKLFDKIRITEKIPTRGIYSCFMLKNGIRKEIESIGKLHLRQDQYTCFYTDPTVCHMRFDKGDEFMITDIFYSPILVSELELYFPELKKVFNASPEQLPVTGGWALSSMKVITSHILDCPYDEATRQFYFNLKVRELLYEILQCAYKRKPTMHAYTPWEVARIYETRTILESYMAKKSPTIKALAKLVALNTYKLKKGFRQYFNVSILEWMMERKMQYAKELLLTTNKPVKEIGVLIGYPRSSTFITAFRRKFKGTPRSIRQNNTIRKTFASPF